MTYDPTKISINLQQTQTHWLWFILDNEGDEISGGFSGDYNESCRLALENFNVLTNEKTKQ